MTAYPKTADYDLEEALTQLGTGEAMVTILSERGAPTPVVWTRMRPPTSLMAAVPGPDIEPAAKTSPLWERYAVEIDRESARELLAAKMGAGAASAPQSVAEIEEELRRPPDVPEPLPEDEPSPRPRRRKADDDKGVVDFLKSRQGQSLVKTVARGVFGLLKKRR